MMSKARIGAFLLTPVAFPLVARADQVRFQLPIACEIGRSCEIQNYVDVDPSPGARDYRCGTLSYQNHSGTDFRLRDLAAAAAGVAVKAAADGRVLRARDGVPDVSVRKGGAVGGRECGNGVVIAHQGGFETQYCHMANGSIAVKPGEEVKAGQAVGKVGLSGQTEYPHLHFTVRFNGKTVDPFSFGVAEGTCGGEGASLWDPALAPQLAYKARAVLNAGFAKGPVDMEAVEAGEASGAPPRQDWPALVAYVRAIGGKAGDIQHLKITGPDGAVLTESSAPALQRPQAQMMFFAGKKAGPAGFASGAYEATYTIENAGAVVLERSFKARL